MRWNTHLAFNGAHAFLSASKYHWVNYTDEKIIDAYNTWKAAQRGTELHALAANLINMGVHMPKSKKAFDRYVNDGIGFMMKTEQVLFYSENCFGTADAISFKKNFLRIHDLKTGVSKTSFKQLEIYAALFCLEYNINPNDIDMELRLYQLNEVRIHIPEPEEILYIMNKIIVADKQVEDLKQGM